MSATHTNAIDGAGETRTRERKRGIPIRLRAIAAGIILPLVLSSAPGRAWAEPSEADIAQARKLFDQGKKLEEDDRWAEALVTFKKVGEVKMTSQVRFHIALAEENLGHLASALRGFEEAEELARKEPDTSKQVLEKAPEHAAPLRERVPKLRIDVEGSGPYRVFVDGEPLSPSELGVEMPLDPGTHTIALEVTNAKGVQIRPVKEVLLAESGREHVLVKIPKDEEAPVAILPVEKPKPVPAQHGSKVPAIVVGSVGVGSLVGAGIFLGLRQSGIAEVRASCKDPVNARGCDPNLQSVADKGRTYTYVSATLAVVGAAGLAASVALWFTVGADKPNQTATRVTLSPGFIAVDRRF